MKISKVLSYVVLAVGAVGIVLWFLMTSSFTKMMEENGVAEARELPLEVASAAVNPLYYITLIVFGLVILVTLITVFSSLAKNPAGIKKAAIGIVVFAVVAVIGYVLAQGVETPMKDGEILSAGGSKLVGAGLYMFYILAIIAVGLMVISGFKKLIK